MVFILPLMSLCYLYFDAILDRHQSQGHRSPDWSEGFRLAYLISQYMTRMTRVHKVVKKHQKFKWNHGKPELIWWIDICIMWLIKINVKTSWLSFFFLQSRQYIVMFVTLLEFTYCYSYDTHYKYYTNTNIRICCYTYLRN